MATTTHHIATLAAAVTTALTALTCGLAVVLCATYVPSGAQAWDDPSLGGGGTTWTDAHRWAALVWLLAAGGAVVALAVWTVRTRAGRRGGYALAGTVLSALAALVALTTRGLVQWDQLALWAVVVGTDIDGYAAALDDGVRFVLVDGAEVGRGAYGAALAVHLLAHALGLAAAIGALVALRRVASRDQETSGRAGGS